MNAVKIAKNLEDIIRFGPVMMSQEYADSVREALLAFDAIRKLLKVQWESEHNYTRGFVKEVNEILSEFHLTEDEITELAARHKESDRKVCRNCKHLSDEQTVIGRKCICPTKEFHTPSAMWKPGSTPACKNFESKTEKGEIDDTLRNCPSVKPKAKPEWVPIKTRPLTEKEKAEMDTEAGALQRK